MLYDANNRPIASSTLRKGANASAKDTAWDALRKIGVQVDETGDMHIPADVLKRIRSERMRRVAVTGIPHTPRQLQRDAGGVAVAKGASKINSVSLEGLRRIRERAPVLQVIHGARSYQLRHLCRKFSGKKGDIGWRIVHKDFKTPNVQVPDSIKPYIQRVEQLFEKPSDQYEYPTLASVLNPIMDDYLTINRPSVEIIHSLLDPHRIVQFQPADGAILWPTLVWLEKWKQDTPGWAGHYGGDDLTVQDQLEIASAAIQYDLSGARFAIVRDGLLEGVMRPADCIVAPLINRTDIAVAGYPPSHVEQALDLVTAFIRAFDFNSNYFTRGAMAEFILAVSADYHDSDIDAFVDMWRESVQGVDAVWQPPILPVGENGDVTKIDLRESNREMMFEVFLAVLIALSAGIYRMDPSMLNAKPWDGAGGPKLSEPGRGDEQKLAKEEGLQGDMQHLTDSILTPICQRAHPDLLCVWEYGDYDPQEEAKLYDIRTNIDWSRNDVKIMEGESPRGFWMSDDDLEKASDEEQQKYWDNPYNWPKDSVFAGAINSAKTLKQQNDQFAQQQAAGMQPQGEPSDDPYAKDQDGFGGSGHADNGFGVPTPRTPFGKPGAAPGGAPGAPRPSASPPPRPTPPTPSASSPMRKGRRPVVVVYDDLEA